MDIFLGCLSDQEQSLQINVMALKASSNHLSDISASSLAVRGEIIVLNQAIHELQARMCAAKLIFKKFFNVKNCEASKILAEWFHDLCSE